MVDFIKPNLLGTKKEFQNRFINPIQNGQCSNSTPRDVRVMKLRCHVLFKLLSGCVQVSLPDLQQNYSAFISKVFSKFYYVQISTISALSYFTKTFLPRSSNNFRFNFRYLTFTKGNIKDVEIRSNEPLPS